MGTLRSRPGRPGLDMLAIVSGLRPRNVSCVHLSPVVTRYVSPARRTCGRLGPVSPRSVAEQNRLGLRGSRAIAVDDVAYALVASASKVSVR
jgi:hypothetical protein